MRSSIHEQHLPKAALYAMGAALMLAGTGVAVKIIGVRASIDTVLFFRYLIALISILPWVVKNPRRMFVMSKPIQIIGRSIVTFFGVGSLIYALRLISIGNALTLSSTYTLFIPLILLVFHKIKTPHKMWIGIGLGFVGVCIILRPDLATFSVGSISALVSGVFVAVSLIMIRFLTKSMTPAQILFYNFVIGCLITAPLLPFGWIPLEGNILLWLAVSGVFSVAYQALITLALAKGAVRSISPLLYLSIVFGVIADYFLWNLIPDGWAIFGMACVIVGGILTILFGKPTQ